MLFLSKEDMKLVNKRRIIKSVKWIGENINTKQKKGFKGFETVEILVTGSPGDDNFTDYDSWVFEIEVK